MSLSYPAKSLLVVVRHPLVNFDMYAVCLIGTPKSHETYDGPALCGLSKTSDSAPPAVTPNSSFVIARHPFVNFDVREIVFVGASKSHELYDGPFFFDGRQ